MQKIIGVRFKKAGRIHFFNPGQIEISKGDTVIIETSHGLEHGEVVISPRDLGSERIRFDVIRRKANSIDLARIADNHEREKEAFTICQEKIAEHKLPMNLIGVEYAFDWSKVVFSFTADGRVDFRELVKDLAAIFRLRIELRQVGVRDEAKLLGGVGCCGRSLCCATFLGDFVPVSIRMAKEQNLSLNPAKISGICGRLMCCLKYENDYYCEQGTHELVAITEPKLGDRVVIEEGENTIEGTIISINHKMKTATINLDNSKTTIAAWKDIFEIEKADPEIKTIVAAVDEDEEVAETIVESNNDNYPIRNRRPPFRSNPQPQTRSTIQPPSRSNFQSRDNRDNRINNEIRSSRDNRDNRSDKFNRKFPRRDRRSDDFQRSKRNNPRRYNSDDE